MKDDTATGVRRQGVSRAVENWIELAKLVGGVQVSRESCIEPFTPSLTGLYLPLDNRWGIFPLVPQAAD